MGWALLVWELVRFVFDTVFLLTRAAIDHKARAALLLTFAALTVVFGPAGAIVTVLTVVVAASVLRWTNQRWWHRLIGWWWQPAWRGWWVYERRWRQAMKQNWLSTIVDDGLDAFPQLRKVLVGEFGEVLLVHMLIGQALHDYEAKVDELAAAFGAQSCRAYPHYREKRHLRLALNEERRWRVVVRRDGPKRVPAIVRLEFAVKDPLSLPVPPVTVPPCAEAVNYEAVPVGLQENGKTWTLKVRGAHILVAGLTGAGKGSIIWSIVKGLAPAIEAGLVQVWAIDPKGGMELYPGRPLFARYCDTTEAEMAGLLADGVTVIEDRARRLKGTTRLHAPTVEEPLIVIVVDEFASLMKAKSAAKEDKATAEQAKASSTLIVNKGRAVGVVLVGLLQNPRKEVVDMRDEIPERVAMRLLSAEYTDMMFWRGAARSGIRCDLILKSLPGTGYAWSDDVGATVRVRAAFVADDEIHGLALRYRPAGACTDAEFAQWVAVTGARVPDDQLEADDGAALTAAVGPVD